MTEPTDAELDAVLCNHWPAFSMQATLVMMWVRAAMRDALAQWGTPPAVAGEVVAWMDDFGNTFPLAANKGAGSWLDAHKRNWKPLYTTPQPTQAQSGAEPLTVDEVEQLIAQWSYEVHGDRARYLVRMTEQHHGIKGKETGNVD